MNPSASRTATMSQPCSSSPSGRRGQMGWGALEMITPRVSGVVVMCETDWSSSGLLHLATAVSLYSVRRLLVSGTVVEGTEVDEAVFPLQGGARLRGPPRRGRSRPNEKHRQVGVVSDDELGDGGRPGALLDNEDAHGVGPAPGEVGRCG